MFADIYSTTCLLSLTDEAWTSKLTGRKTHPTSIPLVGRDVKYNAMASLDLIRRQDTRNWLGLENYCKQVDMSGPPGF